MRRRERVPPALLSGWGGTIAVAAAALPLVVAGAKKGVDVAVDLAKTNVIGWEKVTSYTKGRGAKAQDVVERVSFNVKAWEIGLAALTLFILTGGPDLLLNKALGLAPGKTWTSFDPFGLLSGSKEGEPRSWWLSDPFGLAEHRSTVPGTSSTSSGRGFGGGSGSRPV